MSKNSERAAGITRRAEIGASPSEQLALLTGARAAIAITRSHAPELVAAGIAADPYISEGDVRQIVFGNLARELGLHRMWELSVVAHKMLRIAGLEHPRIRELGIGNGTTYAAMAVSPLDTLQPTEVAARERRVQVGVTRRAVALFEEAGMLQGVSINVEELTDGPQESNDPLPHAIVSTLFAEYLPEQTMELSVESGAQYAIHADIMHALNIVSPRDIARGVIPIFAKGHEGESIIQARVTHAAGGREIHLAEGAIQVHHDYYDYQLEAAGQTAKRGNPVRNLGGKARESRLTIIQIGNERMVRLWNTEPLEGAKPDEIQFQDEVEYTFAEMYLHSQFDASGLLKAINRAPGVVAHGFRRQQVPLTAIKLVDIQESTPDNPIDGWPDATMPANIMMLNIDVLRQLAGAGKLSLVGEGKQYSLDEFTAQINAYRDRIRANFRIHNPQGLVAMTALTPEAATQMQQAFSI